jgi:hypothetical protein
MERDHPPQVVETLLHHLLPLRRHGRRCACITTQATHVDSETSTLRATHTAALCAHVGKATGPPNDPPLHTPRTQTRPHRGRRTTRSNRAADESATAVCSSEKAPRAVRRVPPVMRMTKAHLDPQPPPGQRPLPPPPKGRRFRPPPCVAASLRARPARGQGGGEARRGGERCGSQGAAPAAAATMRGIRHSLKTLWPIGAGLEALGRREDPEEESGGGG